MKCTFVRRDTTMSSSVLENIVSKEPFIKQLSSIWVDHPLRAVFSEATDVSNYFSEAQMESCLFATACLPCCHRSPNRLSIKIGLSTL